MGVVVINHPQLIYCADGNPSYTRIAVECGWEYGARLPSTVYMRPVFADQDWKFPDRAGYMRAIAEHRPAMATVLDWEREEQWPEVLAWAEEAAQYVTESVVIIPKVPGLVSMIPQRVSNRRVVLGYSVPTKYGGTPCAIWEFWGRAVHLLGGSPHRQMEIWDYMRSRAEVVSLDGNMTAQQSRKCRFWSASPGSKGHWLQLSEAGDYRRVGAHEECFRRSLIAVRDAWSRKGK